MNYNEWKEYFISNRHHFDNIDWSANDTLLQEEKKLITSSLQQFQEGENSEGKHLFAYAKTFPDPEYLECIKLFIKEEQKHAKVLGQIMDIHAIPKKRGHWVDKVFRKLRTLAGLENTIIILLTAEIISKIYYRALRQATSSQLLKEVCDQILRDEDMHIIFQCVTIHSFYRRKSFALKFVNRSLHFGLMLGTIMVVWLYHAKVLKKGGFSLVVFIDNTLKVFFDSSKLIKDGFVANNIQLSPSNT